MAINDKVQQAKDLLKKAREQEKAGTFTDNERAAFKKAIPKFKALADSAKAEQNKVVENVPATNTVTSGVKPYSKDMVDDSGNVTGQRSQAATDYLNSNADIKPVSNVGLGQKGNLDTAQEGLQAQEKGLKEQGDILGLKGVADYMDASKKEKDYLEGSIDRQKQVDEITGDTLEIQRSERLKQNQKQLYNLKNNLSYLGKDSLSDRALNAVSNQIKDAEQTFSNMIKVEDNITSIRDIGLKGKAVEFERQIQGLQDDLDSKISKVVQDAFNEVIKADNDGKLDTIEEINRFRLNVLGRIDTSVEGLTQANIENRKELIKQYNDIINTQKEYVANKNKVNKDMSSAQGFYVNGNGEPIISATTGASIQMPENAPMDPVYDKENGRLITFKKDDNGNIVANVDQVIDQPTFEQSTISNYVGLVASGKINIDDVPDNIRELPSFIDSLNKAEFIKETKDGKVSSQIVDIDGKKVNVVRDEQGNIISKEEITIGDTGTGLGGDLTDTINKIKTDTNVGKWTNNPGNIMGDTQAQKDYATSLGATGFYNSDNGRTYAVFPNMDIGQQALASDLQTKLSGGSSWVTPDTNMIDFATGWTWGPNAEQRNTNAAYNMTEYLRGQGINVNDTTKIQDIPVNKLAEAVQYNEGTLGQQGQDYSGLSDTTKPLDDYQKNILVARLGKQIYGTRISDKEGERVEGFITEGMKQGKDQNTIIDDVLGYNVTENKELGNKIRDILIENSGEEGLAGFDMLGMARLINKGDETQAISKMEKSIYKANNDEDAMKRETSTTFAIDKGDKIVDLINNNLNKLGIVEGNWEKLKSKFAESKEYIKIKGELAGLVSKWRNEMLGSNVTELENEFLEGIIAETKDNPFNAIQKIENFQNMNIDQSNASRKFYGLPEIDRETVTDKNKRVKLYTGQQQNIMQQTEDDDIYNDVFSDGNGGLQDLSGF